MPAENSRIKWIDFARAMAIVFVVLCHATENIYDTRFIVLVSVVVCLVMLMSLWLYRVTPVLRYFVLAGYGGGLLSFGLKNKEKIMVYFGKGTV